MVTKDCLPVLFGVFMTLFLVADHHHTLATETKKEVPMVPNDEHKNDKTSPTSLKSTTLPTVTPSNNCTNGTCPLGGETAHGSVNANGISGYVAENKDMLMRTFYVLIGLTGIIVVYFVVKTIRSYRRTSRTKRYGLLSTRDDQLEMAPLDQDDEDDDLTVFDISNRQK